LLQEKSLEARLSKIKEILEGSTSYLRAQVALKSAFPAESPIMDEPSQQSNPPDQSSGNPGDDELQP